MSDECMQIIDSAFDYLKKESTTSLLTHVGSCEE